MKDRHKITEVRIKQSAEVSSILPQGDGTLLIHDINGKPVAHEQRIGVGYLRDAGKPKILRSIGRRSSDQIGDNPWKKYDKIGFIDTNSVLIDSERFFVSSASLMIWTDEKRRFADAHHVDLLVGFCSVTINPERIAWSDFCRRIQASNVLAATDTFLLIVDSEARLIPSINDRTEPVFEAYFLPDMFTVAYATADSGSESWINREMRRRDRTAKLAMKAIGKNHELLVALKATGSLYIMNSFESEV